MNTTKYSEERGKFFDEACQFLDKSIRCYVTLLQILATIIKKGENIENNKKKFNNIKRDLYNFIYSHKKYYHSHKALIRLNDDTLLHMFDIKVSDPLEEFAKLDDFLSLFRKIKELKDQGKTRGYWRFFAVKNKNEIFKKVKTVLVKNRVTNKEFKDFMETKCLVENMLVSIDGSKKQFSNYKDLQVYMSKRVEDFQNCLVTTERINELSFTFNGIIENFENEKTCGICFDDFENGQEVCRLPCDHFLCKGCAIEWFKIFEDGIEDYLENNSNDNLQTDVNETSESGTNNDSENISNSNLENDQDNYLEIELEDEWVNFQCPFCRYDCT